MWNRARQAALVYTDLTPVLLKLESFAKLVFTPILHVFTRGGVVCSGKNRALRDPRTATLGQQLRRVRRGESDRAEAERRGAHN